ncbi:MAG: DUF4124 domain-containing protein [Pseudomonadota bacterium]
MRPALPLAVVSAALGLLCLSAAQAGEKTYRWVDDKGRAHYSDVKSEKGEQVQVKPGSSITATPKDAPDAAARQLDCQRRRDQVALYKSSADINETDHLGRSRTYTAAERQQLIDRSEQAAETACSQPGVIDTGNASLR